LRWSPTATAAAAAELDFRRLLLADSAQDSVHCNGKEQDYQYRPSSFAALGGQICSKQRINKRRKLGYDEKPLWLPTEEDRENGRTRQPIKTQAVFTYQ